MNRQIECIVRVADPERVHGTLETDGTHVEFTGWMSLLAALESVLKPDAERAAG